MINLDKKKIQAANVIMIETAVGMVRFDTSEKRTTPTAK